MQSIGCSIGMRVRIPEGIETIVETRLFLWSLYRSMDVDNHSYWKVGGSISYQQGCIVHELPFTSTIRVTNSRNALVNPSFVPVTVTE